MKFILFSLIIAFGIGLLCDVPLLYAQGNAVQVYKPIVEIPRLDPNTQSAEEYVRALFYLSISLAAILAFVKILFGGVKWMLSDVVTDKQSAKKDIWGAILGLLIVLAAVLVLDTINPNLTQFNILGNAPALTPFTTDTRSHDDIREEQRTANPVVGSNFSGQYGSPEHIAFVKKCRGDGGWPVLSATSDRIVECRFSE